MSGTIRSRMEAQRDRHYLRAPRPFDEDSCGHCRHEWPCPDRVAADDTLTDLNNAQIHVPMMVDTGMGDTEFVDDVYTPEGAAIYRAANRHRLIPDPDSRGAA